MPLNPKLSVCASILSHFVTHNSLVCLFVKLLRSVDDIKVGNHISSFIRHSKIVSFVHFIMVVFVSCIYYVFV